MSISDKRSGLLASLILLGLAALIWVGLDPVLPREEEEEATSELQIREVYGKLPLYFIENQGQIDAPVAYYIQGGDKSIYFTESGVTFLLSGPAKEAVGDTPELRPASFDPDRRDHGPSAARQRWTVKLDFVGANADVRPVGEEPTEAVVSYFKGQREAWSTGLPTYGSLAYRDLWPGIDLVYTGTGSRLKYTFVVQPGADPNQIRMTYRGTTRVGINAAGQLEVATPVESFQEDKPYSYQEVEDQRREVAAAYSLEGETSDGVHFGFRLGEYDPQKVLVIDPLVLLYAGYIGGSSADSDTGLGIAVGATGSVYVTGWTRSTAASFPVTVGPDLTQNGNSDAFVTKVNPSGTALDYAGYIGGSSLDEGRGIAVDAAGNAYVIGETFSTEASFPATVGPDLTYNGGPRDAFVAKVNPSGTALDYAGYIGGSSLDEGRGIAVDAEGSAYVIGDTGSTEATFPVSVGPDLTHNGDLDVFVAKVNPSGIALDYAGYIGGSDHDLSLGSGIAVDATDSAYVTGHTFSTEATFPVTVGPDLTFNGDVDAFVAKVNPSGTALDYAGYIGGSSSDRGEGLAVDATGSAYVTGRTQSREGSFPVTVGPDLTYNDTPEGIGGGDTFVTKVNPSGTALDYAGYIGGSGEDSGWGIAVDGAGNAYVTGDTRSSQASFPVTVGPDLTFNGGRDDAFVAKIGIGPVPVGPPFLEIEMSQESYVNGETVTATVFRLTNPTVEPVALELKVWVRINDCLISAFNLGSDGSVAIPAGFDQDFGPFSLRLVTDEVPRGVYEFNSRILDPITGRVLSEDINSFTIQDTLTTSSLPPVSAIDPASCVAPIVPGFPVLLIELSQPNYVNGETATASTYRMVHSRAEDSAVELKVWLGTPIPGLPAHSISNLGADGSFVIPAGLNQELGPLPLFPVDANLQRGTYEFSSRIVHPVTGELLSEDLNFFGIE